MASNLDEVKEGIQGQLSARGRCHLLLDYDGTLTPIADRPEKAVLSEAAEHVLSKLADIPSIRLTVISGRSLAELIRLLPVPNIILAGNHGLEIKGKGLKYINPEAARQRDLINRLSRQLAKRCAKLPGAIVENKGLTLSLHYRLVEPKRREEIASGLSDLMSREDATGQLTVRSGKMIYDIRPKVNWDKGQAALWILGSLYGAQWPQRCLTICIGDDVTDEDAFQALKGKAFTVLVSAKEKQTAADYYLTDPAGVIDFLAWLADRAKKVGDD
jgi:trehalose-phosphatase